MGPLRVAVVGVGSQGQLLAESVRSAGQDEIVAVCDLSEARAGQVAADIGGNAYGDHRQMLDAESPDVVFVASMPATHAGISIDALTAGAHVFCEKPFAMNAQEGHTVATVARREGRQLSVDFNMRFLEQAQALKSSAAETDFGRAVTARAWARSSTAPWWGLHYNSANSGGGVLASSAVHLLDLTMWLADFPAPLKVSARSARVFPTRRGRTAPAGFRLDDYDVEDVVGGLVSCAGGFWLTLDGSWSANRGGDDYGLVLTRERADLELEPTRVTVDTGSGYRTITERPIRGLDLRRSVRTSALHFLHRLRVGEYPMGGCREALMIQSVVDAFYESARTGSEVGVIDCWTDLDEAVGA